MSPLQVLIDFSHVNYCTCFLRCAVIGVDFCEVRDCPFFSHWVWDNRIMVAFHIQPDTISRPHPLQKKWAKRVVIGKALTGEKSYDTAACPFVILTSLKPIKTSPSGFLSITDATADVGCDRLKVTLTFTASSSETVLFAYRSEIRD